MKKHSLAELRAEIDRLDRNIVELLNRRANTVLSIGKFKNKSRLETYVPAREKEVIANILKANRGPLGAPALTSIYREIMSVALSLEKNVRVAYMGPPATFSHQAALRQFGTSVAYIPCDTIEDVFDLVQKDEADYGVVPVENMLEGAVSSTLDRLMNTPLKICAEIYQPVAQYLLASGKREDIRKIVSNPHVFGQCRKWLRSEMPGVDLVPATSTTRAAELAAKDKHVGAIASKLAAEMYHLKILNANIQDVGGNMTRFLVVGKSYGGRTGHDKTSILFSVKHHAGSLHQALGALKRYRLNMTKIESRPNRLKAWEYLFFVDIEGHVQDECVRRAMRDLNKHCLILTIMGSYPRCRP